MSLYGKALTGLNNIINQDKNTLNFHVYPSTRLIFGAEIDLVQTFWILYCRFLNIKAKEISISDEDIAKAKKDQI